MTEAQTTATQLTEDQRGLIFAYADTAADCASALNAFRAASLALNEALGEDDAAIEGFVAECALLGYTDDEIEDMMLFTLAYGPAPEEATGATAPQPKIVDASRINYSDGEWASLGYRVIAIGPFTKTWRRDDPTGPVIALARRWPTGRVPHARIPKGSKD